MVLLSVHDLIPVFMTWYLCTRHGTSVRGPAQVYRTWCQCTLPSTHVHDPAPVYMTALSYKVQLLFKNLINKVESRQPFLSVVLDTKNSPKHLQMNEKNLEVIVKTARLVMKVL